MPLPFKKSGKWGFNWELSPADRAFVGHVAELEHSSVAGLLHRAVIYYADHRLKVSYHEFMQTVKLDTPDELQQKLTLADARRRNLQQDLSEARYELSQARERLKSLGMEV